MSGQKPLGLYVHVPFCAGKCPYCDFYSLRGDEAIRARYAAKIMTEMERYAGLPVDTVYFGGGTPNLLGAETLGALLAHIFATFSVAEDAEITLEANPTRVDGAFFAAVRKAGFNRLSMGVQSADPKELAFLGREHSPVQAARAFSDARVGGFDNISLDLMLALPGQTWETLARSVDFCARLGPEHLSAYLLKVEPGTAFAQRGVEPLDSDAAAELYLLLTERLEQLGYRQYEISNYAQPGRAGRHNLHYWRDEEYLGFGPAAHSFYQGRRFHCPRDLDGFLRGAPPVSDGTGGDFAEFALLNLRLTRGLRRADCRERYGAAGEHAFARVLQNAQKCPPALYRTDGAQLSLTPEGFLVSNALLVRLLDNV